MTALAGDPPLSVIIPTLNEAAHIDAVIGDLLRGDVQEVIVVDGGSCDDTLQRAAVHGVRTCQGPAGRARQMNQGAALAQGTYFFFLHADSRLPPGFDGVIRRVLADGGVAAGAFSLGIAGEAAGLRMVTGGANLRSRLFGMPYGDQGIFLRAARFQRCGGFPDLPIMEDFALMRRLRREGRIVTVPEQILTSSRRWRRQGILRTTLINQAIIAAYLLGVSPKRLRRWYQGPRIL
jgi:rSAM/selenodomain-associated transferase 2